MMPRAARVLPLAVACLAAAMTRPTPQTLAAQGVVRQVDHLVAVVPAPAPLLALLVDTLRLPRAWPIARWGDFVSGGVSLGSVNLELLAGRPGPEGRLAHVVFEPEPLADALAELDRRGLAHGDREPFGDVTGAASATAWTTVELLAQSAPGHLAVLCEYVRPRVADRRRRLTDTLRARDGGPLGIVEAAWIVVGTGGDARFASAWERLLAPADREAGEAWVLAAGPAIRLDAASPKGLRRLVLGVRSLARARAALARAGLLGVSTHAGELRIAPRRVQGLDIRLVEAAARAGA